MIAPRPELPACAAVRETNGAIIAGKRHGDCLASALALGLDKRNLIQGFVTTLGRFVCRKEAYLLMQKAGVESASEGGYRGHELFSEDLY